MAFYCQPAIEKACLSSLKKPVITIEKDCIADSTQTRFINIEKIAIFITLYKIVFVIIAINMLYQRYKNRFRAR